MSPQQTTEFPGSRGADRVSSNAVQPSPLPSSSAPAPSLPSAALPLYYCMTSPAGFISRRRAVFPMEILREVLLAADTSTLAACSQVSLAFLQMTAPMLLTNVHIHGLAGLEHLFCKRVSLIYIPQYIYTIKADRSTSADVARLGGQLPSFVRQDAVVRLRRHAPHTRPTRNLPLSPLGPLQRSHPSREPDPPRTQGLAFPPAAQDQVR